MSHDELFNPFGEKAAAPTQRSAIMARIGMGLFWLVVLALVTARALYQG